MWKRTGGGGVGRDEVAAAVQRIVVGNEAEEMRRRARALKDKAKKAVEEGGSSCSDLNRLIQEIEFISGLR
ncbi:hypothetical protein Acr_06g0015190 [Actinidia rufa]|uniref:Uncharacterized protein n=1 Tax=Actinidia rufa TaxID=165716 RepID=A0A7J0EUE2_9ERIC|nr:hypothetical protein Acr_06g0015190 [Actinidia rufa]